MQKITLTIFLISIILYGSNYTIAESANKTFEYYQVAVKNGDAKAQKILADKFRLGEDIEKNDELAFYWYEQSALQGYAPAQSTLGVYYERGISTPVSAERAFFWYSKAAEQKFALGEYNLGNLYMFNKKYLDYKKAFYWHKKAADQNMEYSQFRLALMYAFAKGVKKDLIQAKYWAQKAVENNHPDAQRFLDYLDSKKSMSNKNEETNTSPQAAF